MDDALKLAREFEHVMCRFRRMDYSVLHPGVGNMEFAVLEMIHKLSAQHDAIYGAAISDLQKKNGNITVGTFQTAPWHGGKRAVRAQY